MQASTLSTRTTGHAWEAEHPRLFLPVGFSSAWLPCVLRWFLFLTLMRIVCIMLFHFCDPFICLSSHLQCNVLCKRVSSNHLSVHVNLQLLRKRCHWTVLQDVMCFDFGFEQVCASLDGESRVPWESCGILWTVPQTYSSGLRSP